MSQLAGRDLGQISISIGTSLALEGLYGIYPDRENQTKSLDKYSSIWINVKTLYRNLVGAINKEDKNVYPDPTAAQLASELINEMSVIEQSIINESGGNVECVFYFCSYVSARRRYKYATFREINTPLQLKYHAKEVEVFTELHRMNIGVDYRKLDLELSSSNDATLILTHYPVDLLNRYNFRRLDLLESHTGRIKPYTKWSSKLITRGDVELLPFDEMTLQVFGDSYMFSGHTAKVKALILEIAEKNRWTPITTKDYVVKCVKDYGDVFLTDIVTRYYQK